MEKEHKVEQVASKKAFAAQLLAAKKTYTLELSAAKKILTDEYVSAGKIAAAQAAAKQKSLQEQLDLATHQLMEAKTKLAQGREDSRALEVERATTSRLLDLLRAQPQQQQQHQQPHGDIASLALAALLSSHEKRDGYTRISDMRDMADLLRGQCFHPTPPHPPA